MKIVVVYNRESRNVINLFGTPNREKYGLKAIARIVDALKEGGHQVKALEGDKDLVARLEEFMPKVVSGERPGMVFNLSYGIQGQARYTHVPSILEMMGVPYVGSGPLAHSLALDKVVAKVLFLQHHVPTPRFAVLKDRDFELPAISFPLIVKPKNESTSFGLKVVKNEQELREGADVIFDKFEQAVLVEEFIEGREINVGLIGNGPPDAFPPAELDFGGGETVYSYEDKTHRSGREVTVVCPAPLTPDQISEAQRVARGAFESLGCFDCARVDLRLAPDGKFYVLEINSLPSLGPRGSFVRGAEVAGLDFPALINRLVDVASARYFGTPEPAHLPGSRGRRRQTVSDYLVGRRDRIEQRLQEWVNVTSRTDDPVGQELAFERLDRTMTQIGMKAIDTGSRTPAIRAWQTDAGLDGGTLLIGHLDTPLSGGARHSEFRREPEWLSGDGIGVSRGPLVALEFALRAGKSVAKLQKTPVAVLYYGDEGRDCRYSGHVIAELAARASRVLVLRPAGAEGELIVGRRGLRKYSLTVEGQAVRLGAASRKKAAMHWLFERMPAVYALNDRRSRIALSVADIGIDAYPMNVAHRVNLVLQVSYPTTDSIEKAESRLKEALGGGAKWTLSTVSDRPPMIESASNRALAKSIVHRAKKMEIRLKTNTSALPSAAGHVPDTVPVVCGLGPVTIDQNTVVEKVSRISLVQRTILLASLLFENEDDGDA